MNGGHQSQDGWIGVDLDGTLAVYDQWRGAEHIGDPIAPMVERVRKWIAEGKNVRIITARVYAPLNNARRQYEAAQAMLAIQRWCAIHLGKALPVTCVKDFSMIEFWDDRAVQVIRNLGHPVDPSMRGEGI